MREGLLEAQGQSHQEGKMPEHLQDFGSHYEVWRLDDGRLWVNVVHTNMGELRAQRRYSPQQWWNRYGHQSPDNDTMAIKHAGSLVRTYQPEFQVGQVAFHFGTPGETPDRAHPTIVPPPKAPAADLEAPHEMGTAMLTENDVIDAVCKFLTARGFQIVQRRSTQETGDDLVAERTKPEQLRISIEVKGETSARETSARFGSGFNSAQINVHVAEAVYRALAVLSRNQGEHAGIALPASAHHKRRIDLVRPLLRKLDVAVFWVNHEGEATCDSPWFAGT
jgi:hypothetical protein